MLDKKRNKPPEWKLELESLKIKAGETGYPSYHYITATQDISQISQILRSTWSLVMSAEEKVQRIF